MLNHWAIDADNGLDGNKFEVVNQFCYLDNMISSEGGPETSIVASRKSGWKSFRVLLPLLASRVISFSTRERLYAVCVKSIMAYGSETWS